MKTILVIDDDAAIIRGIEAALTEEHFNVISAATGEKGRLMARREGVQLIILDLRLPDMSGEDICRELRKEGVNTPILMLTSKKQEPDKVLGLELGADDYMTKPFSLRELVARVRALLRRNARISREIDEYAFGSIQIDFRKQEAMKKGKPVRLSSREFQVLKFLIQHEREVVTREMLLNEVWGYEQFPTTRTVDNYVLALRKKLEDTPATPKHILTVPTAGYKFVS